MMSKKNYLKPNTARVLSITEDLMEDEGGIKIVSGEEHGPFDAKPHNGESTMDDNWDDESNLQYPHSLWDD